MSNQLTQYVEFLEIRRSGKLRNARIAGGIFLISLLAFVAYGLIAEPQGRPVYLSASIVGALGLSYLNAWVRLEITNNTLEIVKRINQAAIQSI